LTPASTPASTPPPLPPRLLPPLTPFFTRFPIPFRPSFLPSLQCLSFWKGLHRIPHPVFAHPMRSAPVRPIFPEHPHRCMVQGAAVTTTTSLKRNQP
jgi:hypothetical protein